MYIKQFQFQGVPSVKCWVNKFSVFKIELLIRFFLFPIKKVKFGKRPFYKIPSTSMIKICLILRMVK